MGKLERIVENLERIAASLPGDWRSDELEQFAAELEEYRLNYGDQSIGEQGILTPDGTFTSS